MHANNKIKHVILRYTQANQYRFMRDDKTSHTYFRLSLYLDISMFFKCLKRLHVV
jgi:hypothetical protein